MGFFGSYDRGTKIFSITPVKDELCSFEDDLAIWVKKHNHFFRDLDSESFKEQQKISDWVVDSNKYQERAIEKFLGESVADTFLIAYAKVHNLTVVTLEKAAPKSTKVIKIPDVCQQFKVNYVDTFQMMRALKCKLYISNSKNNH